MQDESKLGIARPSYDAGGRGWGKPIREPVGHFVVCFAQYILKVGRR